MTKKVKPEDRKKRGRPTKYTVELGEEICDVIATSELGLVHLCAAHPHWPERANIFLWLRKYPEFRDKYTKAKEDQVEVSVEYMQELMNEPHKWIDEESGVQKLDHNMMRMKMDAIKWQASKLKAKKYGETKDILPPTTELDDDCKKRYSEMDKRNRKEY
ncbi:hypothetical protein UFOVP260_13 [uncultured Caudovirales phage]|uniref:Terminase small subunit n=1 Tax=uncultured Caudovirales phage TaxID=2100421 RepID=A0A6J5L0U9_9CAUD|nr:hypothetical protein UFOVP85_49 [uncultured Caudovirales phage]CAB4132375.1 hypothetical protein UFOVP260_13 [uncultured Caudovirales phage]CAB4202769.1 hypothetical protein UFOVP1363_32 [uncultured Caudovirales phage]CAB5207034.1 hypothetical protein UFOVP179_6 [uncultured Caudovirales phage]